MRTGETTAYGWLAGKRGMAGRPACRIYILSEAGDRGRRRKIVTNGARTAVQRFLFPKFFPKNLAKKLKRVLQWRISGTARVRVRFCSTPPPFRADEKYPGVVPEGRISRRGIRYAR